MTIRRLHSAPTDAEYIQAFRENDNARITWFYRQYREDTYAHVLKEFEIRLEEDREDIFQEAVARLWENIQRGKLSEDTLISSLYKYFKCMVDNVAKEHIRKQMHYLVMDIETERVRDVDSVGMEKMHYAEDEATAVLMQYFYEELMKERRALTKAATLDPGITEHLFDYAHNALARAQRRMQQHTKYSKPYYWAGFIMLD